MKYLSALIFVISIVFVWQMWQDNSHLQKQKKDIMNEKVVRIVVNTTSEIYIDGVPVLTDFFGIKGSIIAADDFYYSYQGEEELVFDHRGAYILLNGRVFGVSLNENAVLSEELMNCSYVHIFGDINKKLASTLERMPNLNILKIEDATDEGLLWLSSNLKLKGLDIAGSRVSSKGVLHLLSQHDLCMLNLGNAKIDSEMIEKINKLKYLKQLHCNFSHTVDDSIAKLYLPELWSLELAGCQVSDKIANTIGKLARLQNLNVMSTQITDVSLSEIADLKKLKHLSLYLNKITDDGIKKLKNTQISHLDLGTTKVTDNALQNLPEKIQYLNLMHTKVTDVGIEYLLSYPNLQGLDLQGTKISDASLQTISKLQNLNYLGLWATNITAKGLANLAQNTNITTLYLSGETIDDLALQSVDRLYNMEKLFLHNTKITDDSMNIISQMKNLQILDISNSNITDSGANVVSKLINLNSLTLQGNKISSVGLQQIDNLSNLCILNLNATLLDDSVVEHLITLQNLRFLSISGTKITASAVEKLQRELPFCLILR